MPTFSVKKRCNPPIPIPPILQGETKNILSQSLFVMAFTPTVANNITVYIKSTARSTLRYIVSLLRMNNTLALTLRA
jgi:hypothetical protein